jgi:hypothetical protein
MSRNNTKVEVRRMVDKYYLDIESKEQEYASFESRSNEALMKKHNSKVKVVFTSPITGQEYIEECTKAAAEVLIDSLKSYNAEYKIIS